MMVAREIHDVLSGRSAARADVFIKGDRSAPLFYKRYGANDLYVKAGAVIGVHGAILRFPDGEAPVIMPELVAGTDYAIYACSDGSVIADASHVAPADYDIATSRKIGGFHYGLVVPGTTVAGGQFATSGNGMIWKQADVDLIAGINAYSIWDLAYRPACPDPRGMARSIGGAWFDIYFCNPDVDANGSSRYNTAVASGAVLPKKPQAFGGNGVATYPNMTWWVANELARAVGKRLPWEHEFVDAAFGVTEALALGGASETIPATAREPRFTSRIGLEQATGHINTWGLDAGQTGETYGWANITGGRGNSHTTGNKRVLLGGYRTDGSNAGSRCSGWSYAPSYSSWIIGLRAACDHLQLD